MIRQKGNKSNLGNFSLIVVFLFLIGLLFSAVKVSNTPQAEISNGIMKASLYLPDAKEGYYRGTRFDWSVVISSLEYKGHSYFGQWFVDYSPTKHDAIMGPV